MTTSVVLLCAALVAPNFDTPSAPLKRVLVYTQSSGFEHDVVKRAQPDELSLVERSLVEMGRESGRFTAIPTRDVAQFDADELAHYDAVFFYTTGELPLSDAQRRALLDFVKNGKSFVGAHCATDTFYKVPEYGEMIGAYFDGHPWHDKVRVKVEDRTHPATAHLGASFDVEDEIYQFKAPYDRAKLHVLLSLDTDSIDMKRDGIHRTDRDFALAWTHDFGKGRVFYTALGHQPEVWADPRFRAHLVGGLRWALRDEPKTDATSVPTRPEDEYRSFAATHAGDPRSGSQVFRRDSGPMCVRCHMVNGQGGTVGPDLSSIGVKYKHDELATQILEPSLLIEPAYAAVILELDDGTLATGIVKHETKDAIELWDTNGQARTIETKHVARRTASKVSLMPEGLARLITREEFADLVAYLQTLKAPVK